LDIEQSGALVMIEIETFQQTLPHDITLSCRAAGTRGRPVLMFLHGFPEAAFVWDKLLEHFAKPENGGYRCIAPNLRGFEKSSSPTEVSAYRVKFLMEDIAALVAIETADSGNQLACMVAHDWGGAVAWSIGNHMPHLTKKLCIINSPHTGTFIRELSHNPKQQAASDYMNFLVRPGFEKALIRDDFKLLFGFFTNAGAEHGAFAWLTPAIKQQYRDVWNAGLTGGCNYYRASPLRPPTDSDQGAAGTDIPHDLLTVDLPTLVIWAMNDVALLPELIEGLDDYIPNLTLKKVPDATHWVIHEQPQLVAGYVQDFLNQ
jgi:pimeloyl-ACP methyl ester carboxylesterase